MNMLSSHHRIPAHSIASRYESGHQSPSGMKSPLRHQLISERMGIVSNERINSFCDPERTGIVRPRMLTERSGFNNDRSIFANEKSNFANNDHAKLVTSLLNFESDRAAGLASNNDRYAFVNEQRQSIVHGAGMPKDRPSLSQRMSLASERANLPAQRQRILSDGYADRHHTSPSVRQRIIEDRDIAPGERAPQSTERAHIDNHSDQTPNQRNDDDERKSKSPLHPIMPSDRPQQMHSTFTPSNFDRGPIIHSEYRDYNDRYMGPRTTHLRSPPKHMEHKSSSNYVPPTILTANSHEKRFMYHIPQARLESIKTTESMISTNSNNHPIMVPTTSAHDKEPRFHTIEHFDNYHFDKSPWKNYTFIDKSDNFRSSLAPKDGSLPGEKHTTSFTPSSHVMQSQNVTNHLTSMARERSPTQRRQNSYSHINNPVYSTFSEQPERQFDWEPGQQNTYPVSPNRVHDLSAERHYPPNGRSRTSNDTAQVFPHERSRLSLSPSPHCPSLLSDNVVPVARQCSYTYESRSPRKISASSEGDIEQTVSQTYLSSINQAQLDRGSVSSDKQPPMLHRNNSRSPDAKSLSTGNSPQRVSPISPSNNLTSCENINAETRQFYSENDEQYTAKIIEVPTLSKRLSPISLVQNHEPEAVLIAPFPYVSEDKRIDSLEQSKNQLPNDQSNYFLEKQPSLSRQESRDTHRSSSPFEKDSRENFTPPPPPAPPNVVILNTEEGREHGDKENAGDDNDDHNDEHDNEHADDEVDEYDDDDEDHEHDHDFDDYNLSSGETIGYGDDEIMFTDENNNVVDENTSVLLPDRPSMLSDAPSMLSVLSDCPSMISESPTMVLATCERPPMLTESPSMVSAIPVRPSMVTSDANCDENMMETTSDKSYVVRRGKRKKYQKYTPADRIAIGKFCFEHGPAAARKAFQSRYPEMSESVTRGFRDKYKLMIGEYAVYMFEQKRRREMQSRNESLPRGRPRKYKQIDMNDKPTITVVMSSLASTSHTDDANSEAILTTSIINPAHTIDSSSSPVMSSVVTSQNIQSPGTNLHSPPSPPRESNDVTSPVSSYQIRSFESVKHGSNNDVTMEVDERVNDVTREDMLTIGWFCSKHGGEIALKVFSEEHPNLTYEKVLSFHKFYLESEGHVTQGDHGNVLVVQPGNDPVHPVPPNDTTTHSVENNQNLRSPRNESQEPHLTDSASNERSSSERETDSVSKCDDVNLKDSNAALDVSPQVLASCDTNSMTSSHTIHTPRIIHYPKTSSENISNVQVRSGQREFKKEGYTVAPKVEGSNYEYTGGYPYDRPLYMYAPENHLSHVPNSLPRTKRFKYQKYSPEDRFNIGKLCNDIGLGATVKVYREQFPRLNESVVRTFRNKYRELLQKGNGVPVAEAIQRKPSRRSITSLIENDVVSRLRQLKQSNIEVTDQLVVAVAENIIAAKDEKEIGSIKNTVTKEWASSLLWKHKLVERQCSNPNGVCCDRCKTPLVCPKC